MCICTYFIYALEGHAERYGTINFLMPCTNFLFKKTQEATPHQKRAWQAATLLSRPIDYSIQTLATPGIIYSLKIKDIALNIKNRRWGKMIVNIHLFLISTPLNAIIYTIFHVAKFILGTFISNPFFTIRGVIKPNLAIKHHQNHNDVLDAIGGIDLITKGISFMQDFREKRGRSTST